MARKVCLGGTFNIIHDGHLALLRKAFESGDEIYIGLTTDEMASSSRDIAIQDYSIRFLNLSKVLDEISGGKSFHLFPLEDSVGPAARENYDAIVVSSDTIGGAEKINEARRRNGLKPLEIIIIDMVLARDGRPISATRVLGGRIGPDGSVKQ